MPEIHLMTHIAAPPERVFDLCLDVGVHMQSTGAHEEIVGGVTEGLMVLGDEVTWRARHFGIPWTMTSKITVYDRPRSFVDEQQRGPFRSWWHRHELRAVEGGTEMIDEVRFLSPVGPIGVLVDRVVLERYMRTLLELRNDFIRHAAESAP